MKSNCNLMDNKVTIFHMKKCDYSRDLCLSSGLTPSKNQVASREIWFYFIYPLVNIISPCSNAVFCRTYDCKLLQELKEGVPSFSAPPDTSVPEKYQAYIVENKVELYTMDLANWTNFHWLAKLEYMGYYIYQQCGC